MLDEDRERERERGRMGERELIGIIKF